MQHILKSIAYLCSLAVAVAHFGSLTRDAPEVNHMLATSNSISDARGQTMQTTRPGVTQHFPNILPTQPNLQIPAQGMPVHTQSNQLHGLSQYQPSVISNPQHSPIVNEAVQMGLSRNVRRPQPDAYVVTGWTPTSWTWTPATWAPFLAPGFKNERDAVAWTNGISPEHHETYDYSPAPGYLHHSSGDAAGWYQNNGARVENADDLASQKTSQVRFPKRRPNMRQSQNSHHRRL